MPLTSDIDAQRAALDSADDVTVPLFPTGADDTRNTMFVAAVHEADAIRHACATTTWTEEGSHDLYPVYATLAHQLPVIRLVPTEHAPEHAEFLWSRARVLMAGAGFCNHAALSDILTSLYPLCPFDGGATLEEWREDLIKAHKACGWPVTMGHVRWAELVYAIDMVHPESLGVPDLWNSTVALLHVLKHLRKLTTGALAYVYNGVGSTIEPETSSDTIGNWTKQKSTIMRSLGCRPAKGRKEVHPLTSAMEFALNRLTVASLLTMAPLTELPPHVVAGPWSTVRPDPSHMRGFFQTGLRVDGVWIAEAGRVKPYTGDQSDVVNFGWNFTNPGAHFQKRDEITRVMPQTYSEGWPSDTFCAAFPNLELTQYPDQDAVRVLLDLPWFASFMRTDRDFAREFPMVLFLPDVPTFDQSTNQGKTMAAHTFGRVMVPAVPLVGAPDTGSAPDSRALATEMMVHGTIVLEEWTPPRSKGHALAHAHLQMLITGASVAIGRVLENTGTLSLKHSMVASAKAVDFPPDMVNRTLFWFMRELTPEEMDRHEAVQRLVNGSLAMEMKLQVIGKVEQTDLMALYRLAPRVKVQGLRFDDHGTLARLLYKLRTGREENGEISKALAIMRSRHTSHTDLADSSGVIASLEDGGMTRVRLTALMAGLDDNQLRDLSQSLQAIRERQGRSVGDWNTPSELINSIRVLRGKNDLQSMLPAIATVKGRPTDRVIVQSLSSDMRLVLPEDRPWAVPDTNYQLVRGPRIGNYLRFRLIETPGPQP